MYLERFFWTMQSFASFGSIGHGASLFAHIKVPDINRNKNDIIKTNSFFSDNKTIPGKEETIPATVAPNPKEIKSAGIAQQTKVDTLENNVNHEKKRLITESFQ